MATTSKDEVREGLYEEDLWDRLGLHLLSYVKSPIQLRYISSKTSIIGRALREGIIDLLDNVTNKSMEINENETNMSNRLCHSREYKLKVKKDESNDNDEELDFQIASLAPTIYSQLRQCLGIPNEKFRQSFSENSLKDFTNPGKSGSLMYKTHDDLFILKTLREYEAQFIMQVLSSYHLLVRKRLTLFCRYIGLYSVRLQGRVKTIEIFIAVILNAFTPSLQINEIFDLKGSKMNRQLKGHFSRETLHKLKDLDFMDLYPYGIRIPTNIYQKLKLVIANDTQNLRKRNITDFSLILGIRHLDMTEIQMIQRRPTTGVGVLFSTTNSLGILDMMKSDSDITSPILNESTTSFTTPYLKPLEMIGEELDRNLYYNDDIIAHASLPIPGIINKTNQRVYLYFALIDMLQTFDNFKFLDQTFRKLTNYNRHLDYSIIEPNAYEKRINHFLFEHVFIDAKDDFPWAITDLSKPVIKINNEDVDNKNNDHEKKRHNRRRPHSIDRQTSNTVMEFRL